MDGGLIYIKPRGSLAKRTGADRLTDIDSDLWQIWPVRSPSDGGEAGRAAQLRLARATARGSAVQLARLLSSARRGGAGQLGRNRRRWLRRRVAAHSPEFTGFGAPVLDSACKKAGEVEEVTPSSMEASGRRFGAAEWLHAGEGRTVPSAVPNSVVQSLVSRAGKPRMKRSRRRTRRRGRWGGAEAGEVHATAA